MAYSPGGISPVAPQPVALQVVAPPAAVSALVQGNGTARGTVVLLGTGTAVKVGTALIPLPQGAPFVEGQVVTVRLDRAANAIHIQSAPSASVPQQTAATATLASLLDRVLTALTLSQQVPAETAARLIPTALPVTGNTLRTLFALLSADGNLGRDLSRVVQWLSRAADAGAISRELAPQIEKLLGPRSGARGADYLDALRTARELAATSLEATLAARANASDDPVADLRLLLGTLRNDRALQAHLQANGAAREFGQALDKIAERLAASSLQNLRSLESPYLYMEVPFPPTSPLQHARIHAFPDAHANRLDSEPRNERLVMELSTTKLGDLWIDLHAHGDQCRCRIEAADDATRDAIDLARAELGEGLRAAGFAEAHIVVAKSTIDRWQRLATLFQRASPMNIEV